MFEKIPWRRERLPTPVFWPGEFHGLYSPWDRKDTTEQLHFSYISEFLKYSFDLFGDFIEKSYSFYAFETCFFHSTL